MEGVVRVEEVRVVGDEEVSGGSESGGSEW